jgi:hypothetical protein
VEKVEFWKMPDKGVECIFENFLVQAGQRASMIQRFFTLFSGTVFRGCWSDQKITTSRAPGIASGIIFTQLEGAICPSRYMIWCAQNTFSAWM